MSLTGIVQCVFVKLTGHLIKTNLVMVEKIAAGISMIKLKIWLWQLKNKVAEQHISNLGVLVLYFACTSKLERLPIL